MGKNAPVWILVILVSIIVIFAGILVFYVIDPNRNKVTISTPTVALNPTPTCIGDFTTPDRAKASMNGCTIIVVISNNSPPFASSTQGVQDGYEIAILKEIEARWKSKYGLTKFEFVPTDPTLRQQAVENKSNNIVAMAISGSVDRCTVDPSALCTMKSHFQDNYGFITINSPADEDFTQRSFCLQYGGKPLRVAVLPKTQVVSVLQSVADTCNNPIQIQQLEYRTRAEAIEAVITGEADIYMTDYEILKVQQNDPEIVEKATDEGKQVYAVELSFLPDKPDEYVFMLPFGNEGLQELLNQELDTIDRAGLCDKYNLPTAKCE